MSPERSRTRVRVDGHELSLSNLGKVLYPQAGFTKGEMVHYYARIAPALLPHVAGRPLTVKRCPDGVDGESFFEKSAPRRRPDWVRTARLPSPSSAKGRAEIDYILLDDVATLVWLANLAAVELHVPQWRVDAEGRPCNNDLLVFDLDPGPPATLVECCQVACLLRDALAADGLAAHPKTSGKKGMQLYVPLRPTPDEQTSRYARGLAERLAREHADLVESRMARRLRPGKVLVDWSQNSGAKTTVAPYSLRATPRPQVSTPLAWEELESCRDLESLRFEADEAAARVERAGDLFAALEAERQRLP